MLTALSYRFYFEAICLAAFPVPAGKPASQSAVSMVSFIVGRTAKFYVSGGQEILAQTEFYQLACAVDENRALICPGAPEEFQSRPHHYRQNATINFWRQTTEQTGIALGSVVEPRAVCEAHLAHNGFRQNEPLENE